MPTLKFAGIALALPPKVPMEKRDPLLENPAVLLRKVGEAVRSGSMEELKRLYCHSGLPIEYADQHMAQAYLNRALIRNVGDGNYDGVKTYLDAGAYVNSVHDGAFSGHVLLLALRKHKETGNPEYLEIAGLLYSRSSCPDSRAPAEDRERAAKFMEDYDRKTGGIKVNIIVPESDTVH